jgi:multimeric flavodoxin WrbA
MSIVIVVSSPREGGFGRRIAEKVAEGIAQAGKKAKIVLLNDLGPVKQCQNCEACKKNGCHCVIKDGITPLLEEIRESEGIVHVNSINFNHVSGLFKTYFDRYFCFLDENSSSTFPTGKKVATIVTAGADDTAAEKEAEEYQKIMAQHFLCEPVGTLTYTSWFLPAGEFADDSVLDRALELGSKS